MRHPASRWFSLRHPLYLSLLVGAACRGPQPSELTLRGLGADPEECRSFATSAGVDVGSTSGELRCRFDAESTEHRCELSVAGELVSTVTEYASLADFVEAGHTLGKRTSLAETRVEKGHPRRLSYRYDELGRLVKSFDEAHARSIVTAYSDHDGAGRPRRALSEIGGASEGCSVWLEDIEYGDGLGTVWHRSRPRDPERCGFAERTLVERYDGAGNRVSVISADAAGITDSLVARHPATSERICL